jgi:hypothetical protein
MATARSINDETVKSKTSKYSSEWYQIIDKFGTVNHTQIAKLLREEYHLSPWWAQIVTNRYEWERGLRNK